MLSWLDQIAGLWFETISEASFQVVLFGIFVFCVSYLFRRRSAIFHYILWGLVLLKACLPPSLPIPMDVQQVMTVPAYTTLNDFWHTAGAVVATASASKYQLQLPLLLFLIWFAGAFTLFCLLIWQNFQLYRALGGAQKLGVEKLSWKVRARLGRIDIFLSPAAAIPFSVGILRPRIYLPTTALTWKKTQLEMVLLHEIAHIKRFDFLVILAQYAILMVYWFHPVVWFVNRQITAFREIACDDYALACSNRSATEYGRFLIENLEKALSWKHLFATANFFQESRRGLVKRFESLFSKRGKVMISIKSFEKTVLAGIFTVAIATSLLNGGVSRNLLAASSKTASKPGLTGVILDAITKQPIQHATVLIDGTRLKTTTAQDGRFDLMEIPPGLYNLEVRAAGYKVLQIKDLQIPMSGSLYRKIYLHPDGGEASKEVAVAVSDVLLTPPLPVHGMDALAKVVTYPDHLIQEKKEGNVRVRVWVNEQGQVEKTALERTFANETTRVVLDAIKNVSWKPGLTIRSEPISAAVELLFRFSIKEDGAAITVSTVPPSPPEPPQMSGTQENTPLFVPYDQPPEPIGGFRAIQKNLFYPDSASRAGLEGTVLLQVLIDTTGEVVAERVVKSIGSRACDRAAIEAVKKTRWRPAFQREKPVKVWVSIPVLFRLKKEDG